MANNEVKKQFEPTEKQKSVISASVDNILVSASAGSGKTTVLVKRIISKIKKGEISIDSILVVTFTKAAANHMKEKMAGALKKEISTNSNNLELVTYLKKQLDLIPNAYIQTLNSFCSRVVKEKGYELVAKENAIEPSMSILGDQELKILLGKAAREAIDSKYLSIVLNGEDVAFDKMTNAFTNGRSDDALIEYLVGVYSKLRSLPNYISKIDEVLNTRRLNDENGVVVFLKEYNQKVISLFDAANKSAKKSVVKIDDTIFSKSENNERQSICKCTLDAIIAKTDEILQISTSDITQEDLFEKIKNTISDIRLLDEIKLSGKDETVQEFKNDFGGVAALWQFATGSYSNGTKHIAYPYVLDQELRDVLTYDVENLLALQRERTVIISSFIELLKKVDECYSNIKRRFHAMDFADQEHFALIALSEPSVRDYYKDKFDEIYVDEYQDNSTLQDAIIQAFSKKNVFMVGDVKQSIYKFRYANPKMFMEKFDEYGKKNGTGTLLDLTENFRSSPEILSFVNAICGQLMSRDTEIDYDKSHEFFINPKAANHGSIPRVVLVNNVTNDEDEETDDDDGPIENVSRISKVEFAGILAEVERYKKEGYNNKDICILTKKKKVSQVIARMLCNRGILAECPESRTIYGDNDISVLCALITLLGNEHRDECLLGVLLGNYRFSNFTVNEISTICAYAHKEKMDACNLIIKVRSFGEMENIDECDVELQKRVNRFIDVFDNLKSDSIILNIGELIERIYSESGIKATLDKANDVDKLIVFKNWLCENYLNRGCDISSIANSLEELKLELGDKAAIEYESQQADSIKCMTYHKSKGLEFKCVIVTDLSSKDREETTSDIVFDENRGFLCNDYSDKDLLVSTSLEKLMFAYEVKLADVSEVIRLFYVALTRAEDRMSVVTSYSLGANPKEKYECIYRQIVAQEEKKFDKNFVLKQKNRKYLFLSSLLRLKAGKNLFDLVENAAEIKCPSEQNMYVDGFDGFELVTIDYDESLIEREAKAVTIEAEYEECLASIDEYGNPFFDEYQYEKSVLEPAKTSVSQLLVEEQKLLENSSDREIKKHTENNGDFKKKSLSLALTVPDIEYFSSENDYKTPALKGTLIHNLLRFMDFGDMFAKKQNGHSSMLVITDEIDKLKNDGVIKPSMMEVIDEFKGSLTKFVDSELFDRIAQAEIRGEADFEKPIMFSTEIKDTDDYTLVQGIIDVLFYEDGEAVIVDYKTDSVPTNDVDKIKRIIAEKHKLQIDLYSSALIASGIKVKSRFIWLIRNGIAIQL